MCGTSAWRTFPSPTRHHVDIRRSCLPPGVRCSTFLFHRQGFIAVALIIYFRLQLRLTTTATMETPATTSRVNELVAAQWPYVASTLLVCAAAWVLQAVLTQTPISKIPFIGLELGDADKRRLVYMRSAKQLYLDGYKKASSQLYQTSVRAPANPHIVQFKNGVFRITTTRGRSPRLRSHMQDSIGACPLLTAKPVYSIQCYCSRPQIPE